MGIDLSSLPPWAQKQVADKLIAGRGGKPQADNKSQKGEAKYHNKPDYRTVDGGASIRFASKKEARRYDELMLMLQAGKIRDLKLQPQFTLQEAYTTPDGKRVRAIRYDADFSYYDCDTGESVVEDVKSNATKTRVYQMKRKLMLEKFGIEIREV